MSSNKDKKRVLPGYNGNNSVIPKQSNIESPKIDQKSKADQEIETMLVKQLQEEKKELKDENKHLNKVIHDLKDQLSNEILNKQSISPGKKITADQLWDAIKQNQGMLFNWFMHNKPGDICVRKESLHLLVFIINSLI